MLFEGELKMVKSKKIISLILIMSSVAIFSTSVFAATASFSGILPKYQGDTEVSVVRRASDNTGYFTIRVDSIQYGTNSVCAWTEGSWGGNYSNPYNQAGIGDKRNISYSTPPAKGENVILNLDNPVNVDYTVEVSGIWSPN